MFVGTIVFSCLATNCSRSAVLFFSPFLSLGIFFTLKNSQLVYVFRATFGLNRKSIDEDTIATHSIEICSAASMYLSVCAVSQLCPIN